MQLIFIILFLPFYIVYKIIKAIYTRRQKKLKKAKIEAMAPSVRRSLRKDRELLMSVIVDVIKQHWDTLEDKLELYTVEDDYGNTSLKKGFKQELIYFSEKVVLPELDRRIASGETSNKNLTFILQDTTRIFQDIPADYFGITFEDSNHDIAVKLLSAVSTSHTGDELLYELYTDPGKMEDYLNKTKIIFMHQALITVSFRDMLQTSEPITATPFVSLVFTLFSALHNTKKNTKKYHSLADFVGNDPYKYEEFIKTVLRNEGFGAKRTRGSGDFGVDVVASKNGKTFAIQCKLYNRTVGTKSVQEIVSGRIFYKTDFAVVVSDNSFTPAAKTLARKSDVILTHHRNLLHKLESLAASEGNINRND